MHKNVRIQKLCMDFGNYLKVSRAVALDGLLQVNKDGKDDKESLYQLISQIQKDIEIVSLKMDMTISAVGDKIWSDIFHTKMINISDCFHQPKYHGNIHRVVSDIAFLFFDLEILIFQCREAFN